MAQAFNLTAQLNLRGPANVRQIVADIKKQVGTITGDIKFTIDPAAINNTTKLSKSLQELNVNLANVASSSVSASSAIKNFGQSVSSIGNSSAKLSSSLNKTAQASSTLGTTTAKTSKNIAVARTELEEFGRQGALAIRRFAAFSAVTGVFFSLNRAINSGLKSFIAFDKELVKLQQITGKNAEGLKGLQDEITRLSIGLGVSSDSLIQVASTLAQAGLSATETRASLEALARSSLAPSFDDINSTVEGSIALMRQFGISAKDLEKALGSVNAVAAGFAVEAGDIIAAIQRTGGVFASASKGVSEGTDALNEFIAVFTSVRATTRESAETIATGLRTIFTRIQRQGTIEALREYGVNLTDIEGKFVGAYKAVELLSQGLGKIDPRDIRFSQIVEELGGFRQIGKVIPLIQQFATAQQALKVAQAGQGSLAADALKAQLSLANQIAKVREEFLTLIRTIGSSDTFQTLARGSLIFASGLIKVTDALKGVLPALTILGLGAGIRGLTQFTSGFVGGLKKVPQKEGGAPESISSSIGRNFGQSLVGAKTEQVSRDLDQNSAGLDKVSSKLDNVVSALNSFGSNITGMTTALNNYSSILQQNINSLITNTSSLDNLTNAINNLGTRGPGTEGLNRGGRVMGFARGGVVPGSGNRDTVPAMLMPGEFVIRKKAVETIGTDKLHKMNKYARGGKVKEELKNLNSDTIKGYFNLNQGIDPIDIASTNIKPVAIELNASDFKKMVRIMKETEIKRLMDIQKFGNKKVLSVMKSPSGGWPAGNAFQQLLIQEGIAKGVKVPTNFGTSQESLQDIESEHFAPLDFTTGDAKFVPDFKDVSTKQIIAKRFTYEYNKNTLNPKPTSGRNIFNLPDTSVYYPDEGLKDKFNDWLMKNASDWIGEATVEYDQSNLGYYQTASSGRIIQKLISGGLIRTFTDAGLVSPTGGKPAKRGDILKALNIDEAAEAAGISASKVYELLGLRNPDAQQQAQREAIQKKYIERINRRAGATKGQLTKLANKNLVFGAAGMFGKSIPLKTTTIESPLLSSSPTVGIVGGVMDSKVAEAVLADFNQNIEQATQTGSETLMIGDILSKLGFGKTLNLDFDRTLAVGADKILSDPGTPLYSQFSDRAKVADALKSATLTGLGESLVEMVKERQELLSKMFVVTARPQSTLDLIQSWLSDQGLPIPLGQFKGFGGPQTTADDIAKLKAAFLSPGSLFVDDDPRNIGAADLRKDISTYQYGPKKIKPNPQDVDIQGVLLQKVIETLGGPSAVKGLGFDWPNGLGGAAKYFNLEQYSDIPTDVKRTIVAPSTITDNAVTYLKAMGYNLGGKVYDLQKGTGLSNGEFDQIVKFANTNNFSMDEFKAYLAKTIQNKKNKAGLMMNPASLLRAITPDTPTTTTSQMELARSLMGPPDAKYNPKYSNAIKKAGGGSIQDTVPALLTPGEFVINKKAAQNIGYGELEKLNKADKLQGYNSGGIVGNIQRFAVGGKTWKNKKTGKTVTGTGPLPPGGGLWWEDEWEEVPTPTAPRSSGRPRTIGSFSQVTPEMNERAKAIQESTTQKYSEAYKKAPKYAVEGSNQLTKEQVKTIAQAEYETAAMKEMVDSLKLSSEQRDEINKLQQSITAKYSEEYKNASDAAGKAAVKAQAQLEYTTAARKNIFGTEKPEVSGPGPARTDKSKSSADADAANAYFALRAKLAGQTVEQFAQNLGKEAIDLAEKMKNELPEALDRLQLEFFDASEKIKNIQEGGITDTEQTDLSQLKESLGSSFEQIFGSGFDKQLLDKAFEELQAGANPADIFKSEDFMKAIESSSGNDALLQRAIDEMSRIYKVDPSKLTGATKENFESKLNFSALQKRIDESGKRLAQWSLGISAAGSVISKFIAATDSRSSTIASAAIGAGTATFGAVGAGLKETSGFLADAGSKIGGSFGQSLGGVASFLSGPFGVAAAAAIGLADAFKEAWNAAREFDKNLAQSKVEQSLDRVNELFDDFAKDPNNKNLLKNISEQLNIGISNAIAAINIDATVPKMFWLNMADAATGGSDAAQRSQILEKKGSFAYLESTSLFGKGAMGLEKNMFDLAPQLASQQAQTFKPMADNIFRLFDSKLRAGSSIDEVMSELRDATGEPTKFANVIARSNPLIEEEIIKIKARADLNEAEKQTITNSIIAREAETQAILNVKQSFRAIQFEKLNKETGKFINSLERIYSGLESVLNKASFEIQLLSNSAEAASAALSGQAKAGTTSIRAINVLQNPRSYSNADTANAANIGSQFFGGASPAIASILNIGDKLESTILSTINRVRQSEPGATDERVAASVRSSLDRALTDLNIPPNLVPKLSSSIKDVFQKMSTQGDLDTIDFEAIVEEVPALAKQLDAARRAQESAVKALELYQSQLNEYANAMNTMVELQFEANKDFAKTSDILRDGNNELSKVLGKEISLRTQVNDILAKTSSRTGGAVAPVDIKRNILNLEDTRKELQARSDVAANKGLSGAKEFELFQNRLRPVNLALRENYDALKNLAESGEIASAALGKIQEIQQKRQAGVNIIEKLVTSSPEEIGKLNAAISRLNNNMAGIANVGTTSEQRGESLQAFNMIAPLLGEGQQQNAIKANVLESMLLESGQGITPMFAQVLDSLRNPEADPEMAAAIETYKEGLTLQSQANVILGELKATMISNSADTAAQKLGVVLKVPFDVQAGLLRDIDKHILDLNALVRQNKPAGRLLASGGIVYASAGQAINFTPKGTDTVPAMLTPGEFVVNRAATRRNLPLLQNINSNKYNKGGKVNYLEGGGIVPGELWTSPKKQKEILTDDMITDRPFAYFDKRLSTNDYDTYKEIQASYYGSKAISQNAPWPSGYNLDNKTYNIPLDRKPGIYPDELLLKGKFAPGGVGYAIEPKYTKGQKNLSSASIIAPKQTVDMTQEKRLEYYDIHDQLRRYRDIIDNSKGLERFQKQKSQYVDDTDNKGKLITDIKKSMRLENGLKWIDYTISNLSDVDKNKSMIIKDDYKRFVDDGAYPTTATAVVHGPGVFKGLDSASSTNFRDSEKFILGNLTDIQNRAENYEKIKLDFQDILDGAYKLLPVKDMGLQSMLKDFIFGRFFSIKLNNDIIDHPGTSNIALPLTIYNSDTNDWMENIKEFNIDKKRHKNVIYTGENDLFTLLEKDDKGETTLGAFPWIANDFTDFTGIDQSDFISKQKKQFIPEKLFGSIQTLEYGKPDSLEPYFTYKKVNAFGHTFNKKTKSFDRKITPYYVIGKTGEESPFYDLSDTKKLYIPEEDWNLFENELKTQTSQYDTNGELKRAGEFIYKFNNPMGSYKPIVSNDIGSEYLDILQDYINNGLIIETNDALRNLTINGELFKSRLEKRADEKFKGTRIDAAQKKLLPELKPTEALTNAKKVGIARAVYDIGKNVVGLKSNKPSDMNSVRQVLGELENKATSLSMDTTEAAPNQRIQSKAWLINDAYRAFFNELVYGQEDTAQFLKSQGILLDDSNFTKPKDSPQIPVPGFKDKKEAAYIDYLKPNDVSNAIKNIINREMTIKSGAGFAGSLSEEDKKSLKIQKGQARIYKDSSDTVREDEIIPQSYAEIASIGLNPRNVFPTASFRKDTYLSKLEELYKTGTNDEGDLVFNVGDPNVLTADKSIAMLKTWYSEYQDKYLNMGVDFASSLTELKKQDIKTAFDAAREQAQQAHAFLAGSLYGELPNSDQLSNMIVLEQENPIKKEQAGGLDLEQIVNRAMSFEADGDGKLDREELRQFVIDFFGDEQIINRAMSFDDNGDGKLDRDELRKFGIDFVAPPQAAQAKSRGGLIYASKGQLINFEPKGSDTVPAMLTPGEFVINKTATEKHLPLLKAINSNTYSRGGMIYASEGSKIDNHGHGSTLYSSTTGNILAPVTSAVVAKNAMGATGGAGRVIGSAIDTGLNYAGISAPESLGGSHAATILGEGVDIGREVAHAVHGANSLRTGLAAGAHGLGVGYGLYVANSIGSEIVALRTGERSLSDYSRENDRQRNQSYVQNVGENLINPGRAVGQTVMETSGLLGDINYINQSSAQLKRMEQARQDSKELNKFINTAGTMSLANPNTIPKPQIITRASGGMIYLARGSKQPVYANNGTLIPYQPKNTDIVPAMLTPGEFVINKYSTAKYKPVLEAINSGKYTRGGIVNYLNKGGFIPQYFSDGDIAAKAQTTGAFDFTSFMNSLAGSLSSSITEIFDKALSVLKPPNNNTSGVSNNTDGIASIDTFVNRLNNIANILSNIYIPPQITITGKHDVVVTINGDTVLNQLRPDIQGMVMSQIQSAFSNLKANNPENNTLNFDIGPSAGEQIA